MNKTPMDTLFSQVDWQPSEIKDKSSDLPYATHSGVLQFCGFSFRCFRLNTGQAVIQKEDMDKFFEHLMEEDQ